MSAQTIFDLKVYDELNAVRWAVVARLVSELKGPLALRTAIDVGCGSGYFSGRLNSLGLEVIGVDGRPQNVEDSQRRNPGIRFERFDAEDRALRGLGKFDLVFCFGLLYHLENPLMAIRHLHALTGSLLLVEGVVFQGDQPIMGLVDELQSDDQGLNHLAFYPTEACLQKMLYRAGFAHVYKFAPMPDHPDYRRTKRLPRVRTMLVASHVPISAQSLRLVQEPRTFIAPWDAESVAGSTNSVERLRRFAGKSLPQKMNSIRRIFGK